VSSATCAGNRAGWRACQGFTYLCYFVGGVTWAVCDASR
jgi:hypothetical protein